MPGEQRTAVGLVGNDGRVDGSRIEALPGVAEVIHVSKPYKQVSREWQQREHRGHDRPRRVVRRARRRRSSPDRARWRAKQQIVDRGARRARGRRHGAARRRVQAAQFALRLPGPRQEGARAARRSPSARPASPSSPRRWTRTARTWSPSTPTASRSARATCRTTRCSRAVGRIGKPVLLKRGMAATITDLLMSAEYILAEGNSQVILCERGIRSFDTDDAQPVRPRRRFRSCRSSRTCR